MHRVRLHTERGNGRAVLQGGLDEKGEESFGADVSRSNRKKGKIEDSLTVA